MLWLPRLLYIADVFGMCLQLIFTNFGEPFAQLPISDVSFPWVNPKIRGLSSRYGSVQLITNHTRGKIVLDLFISYNYSLIIKIQVIPGIGDHVAVFVEGNIRLTINKQKRRMVPLYRKTDWDGLKEHMSTYVDSVVHSTDCDLSIDDLGSSFREELTSGIQRFIPHRFTSSRNGLPYVPLIETPHEEKG